MERQPNLKMSFKLCSIELKFWRQRIARPSLPNSISWKFSQGSVTMKQITAKGSGQFMSFNRHWKSQSSEKGLYNSQKQADSANNKF